MPIPNLTTLRAFEAAARHLSFSRAAAELNVQPPAVSRQVADLEAALGVSLFRRTKPRLTLTPAGQVFFAHVSSGFEDIMRGAAAVQSRAPRRPLTVNVSIGIASCWLMARLGSFHALHPDIELQLVTRDTNEDFVTDEADAVVLFSEREPPGVHSRIIFGEELIAVAAPDFLDRASSLTPSDLLATPLLRLRSRDYARDWDTWFRAAGLSAPAPNPALAHNSFIVYLQAALNGEGIALSWRILTDDLMRAGRLVQVTSHTVSTARGYYCRLPPHATTDPWALEFQDWVAMLPGSE